MYLGALVIMVVAQAPAGSVTLSGQVVDAAGQPAAGVEVIFSELAPSISQGAPVRSRTKSDHNGKFQIDYPAVPDPRRQRFLLALWAYAPGAGLTGQAFSPAALPAAGSVRLKLGGPSHTAVRVLGSDGKPVAGARVAPASLRVDGGLERRSTFPPPDSLADLLAATTDAEGNGQIKDCRAEDVEAVWVEAAGFGLQRGNLTAATGGDFTITLRPGGRLTGRVQADDPAARGVEIIATSEPRTSTDPQTWGMGHATTDAEGRFEIPALAAGRLTLKALPSKGSKLRPELLFNLTIEPGKTTDVTIPLEAPPGVRTVAGRVVDREGRPVAGAVVFQSGDSPTRTEAETGPDGRFALSGVAARPTFLFARKSGCRFTGLAFAPTTDDATLTILKTQEPPRLARKTLPPPTTRPEAIALARRLLDPYAELVIKQGDTSEKVRTLEALARIEPERVLELIQQQKVFTGPSFNSMIGLRVAVGLMDESVDEALAVLEALEDPAMKAIGFIDASNRLESQDRPRALAVLDRALLNARAAKEPDGVRLVLMGEVAERFLDLGQADRGRAILREGEALAQQYPKAGWAGYARGAFAEELAQVDLETALELTKDLADAFEFDRHHGNIAHELGGKDPAQAERVLAMVKTRSHRDQYTVRVVYRMAPLDLARARRLTESIGDYCLKGYALGMMALRLAETGNPSAREVLESAYESLERSSRVGQAQSNSIHQITSIAGVLLPVAERIEPALVDEYLWRGLAMRQPNPRDDDLGGRHAQADVCLAMMLARYDRGVARSLVEPLTRRGRRASDLYTNLGELYAAAAAIDPKWAVALVETLPDDPDLMIHSPKNSARLAVANLLGRAGEQQYRKLQNSFLYLWVPDVEDINTAD